MKVLAAAIVGALSGYAIALDAGWVSLLLSIPGLFLAGYGMASLVDDLRRIDHLRRADR